MIGTEPQSLPGALFTPCPVAHGAHWQQEAHALPFLRPSTGQPGGGRVSTASGVKESRKQGGPWLRLGAHAPFAMQLALLLTVICFYMSPWALRPCSDRVLSRGTPSAVW